MADGRTGSGDRKRPYRRRITCSECNKIIDSDYKDRHVNSQHKGKTVTFTEVIDHSQPRLSFFGIRTQKIESEADPKCSKSSDSDLASNASSATADGNVNEESSDCTETRTSSEMAISQENIAQQHEVTTLCEDDKTSPMVTDTCSDPCPESTEPSTCEHHTIPCHEGPHQPVMDKYNPQKFSTESYQRDFQSEWFKIYPWLSYSLEKHEASCYACSHFLSDDTFKFSNWKKTERLKKHHTSTSHKLAMTKWIDHRENIRTKSSVLQQIDSAHKAFVQRNRQYLKTIIECLLYTAQQNIAQRGHDEKRDDISSASDTNRGNFLELLHLRSKDIPWLEERMTSKLKQHAQWTSPIIQNELLQIIADLVVERIKADVVASQKYGIIVDETSDIGRTEQVSICLSFLDKGKKKEAFIGFYETKTTDGETLYALVTKAIGDLNLDLTNIVGECFDGASNMSGKEKGLAGRMKECAPMAIYVHCYGHVLNLALQDTMKEVVPLRNALGTIQSLYNFLEASPKRHALFGDIKVENEHLALTLKSLSITRWSCRWEAVKSVHEQIERIVKALIQLGDDKDPKTYSESRALLTAICDFEFILGLCVLKVILSNTNSLSKYLQAKNMDVITARRNADLTISTLRKCRNEESFENIWERADQISQNMKAWIEDTPVTFRDARVPHRKPSRRLQALVGEGVGIDAPEMTAVRHHRVHTYYSSIDKVLLELDVRFKGNDQDVLCALGAIALNATPSESDYKLVTDFYGLDKDLLEADHALFQESKEKHAKVSLITAPDVVQFMYENELSGMLPEFAKVATILAVIPATSCSAERSFSGLRRLKTYLRSTIGQKRLSSLALISTEREYTNRVIEEDMDKIIDIFGERKGRNKYFF